MKKSLFKKVVLSALLLIGAGNVQAQKGYEVPPMSEELTVMANEVIDFQLSDPDKANKSFTKLMRKIQKDKVGLLSVGQFFLDKNVYPCAVQCAKQLYTLDPTYIPGLMFNGEVCMMRKDYGAAGQKFDEVLTIDSTFVPALKRNAFVYKNVNPHVAIEMLQKIKRVEPNNQSADRDLGDIYYNLDEYKDAVENYKTYFTAVTNNDSTDIRAAENYLQSLYATKNFMEISKLAPRFLALDANDMVLKRMKFFADIENYELDAAKEDMKYISGQEYPDSFYIYLDYVYASNLMAELNDLPSAITYYEKALKRDTAKIAGLKELAMLYRRNKQTKEGLETYQRYMAAVGDKATLSDRFGLGQQYLTASQQTGIPVDEKAKYVASGDKIFADILQEDTPDAYKAALMRAAINITDGTKPEEKVKGYYEQALKLMEGKENINSAKIQALRYLAFYHVQKDEYDLARKYTNEMMAIDQSNGFAKQIDSFLKSMNK